MTKQEQVKRSSRKRETETETEPADPDKAEREEKLKQGLDDILDEIDDVLEDNAQEMMIGIRKEGNERENPVRRSPYVIAGLVSG
jgi:ubiquitin-like protein Pup